MRLMHSWLKVFASVELRDQTPFISPFITKGLYPPLLLYHWIVPTLTFGIFL